MKRLFKHRFLLATFLALLLAMVSVGCGGGGGGDDGSPAVDDTTATGSNQARFYFDCDLQGLTGEMVMDMEVVADTGITWGSGSNPDITGVIGTGDYIIYTQGEIRSPTSYYVFTGENNYADFTDMNTYERFRVEWVEDTDGLIMIVNPFGQAPTQHTCVLTDSELI